MLKPKKNGKFRLQRVAHINSSVCSRDNVNKMSQNIGTIRDRGIDSSSV